MKAGICIFLDVCHTGQNAGGIPLCREHPGIQSLYCSCPAPDRIMDISNRHIT